MSRVCEIACISIPIGTALLFLADVVTALTDDLRPWMPSTIFFAPVGIASLLVVCTAVAWSRRESIWWQSAAVGSLVYLLWNLVALRPVTAAGLFSAYDVLSLVGLGALLIACVVCIRSLPRRTTDA